MDKSDSKTLLRELMWLGAIIGISALIEFAIIENFELHPVLSIKIQVLIGLIVIGYGIRMGARLWKNFSDSEESQPDQTQSPD
ncbi:hypothetical protein [Rhodohalobacter sp. 8-1]|uniref:hypothetical protein n=1 Tax=Rhodohalobacter sp. 8-1 TaxID=3131972 RepID=UPI0030EE7158